MAESSELIVFINMDKCTLGSLMLKMMCTMYADIHSSCQTVSLEQLIEKQYHYLF